LVTVGVGWGVLNGGWGVSRKLPPSTFARPKQPDVT